jgi:hypothetical protein
MKGTIGDTMSRPSGDLAIGRFIRFARSTRSFFGDDPLPRRGIRLSHGTKAWFRHRSCREVGFLSQ